MNSEERMKETIEVWAKEYPYVSHIVDNTAMDIKSKYRLIKDLTFGERYGSSARIKL